ncbi:response regulator transcription factor [Comamonas composti]|uniref:response regulator transcription factor n=1 Tax=Comamonas composti TaxID=408558 RepID=UPI0006870B04|nr:response regulator transcription factor [Comamonas composti]
MQAHPVLMVTQNTSLWQHWQQLSSARWQATRGQNLQDLQRWALQSRQLVMLDAALPRLPSWDDAIWTPLLQGMKVLVLNARPNDSEGRQALARGASGYAHAYASAESLSTVLQNIGAGSIWLGRSLLQRLLQDVDSRLPPPEPQSWIESLSPREQEVARLASLGNSNPDIAERLGISERTVRAHLSAIFEKLEVSDRLMLALKIHGIAHDSPRSTGASAPRKSPALEDR